MLFFILCYCVNIVLKLNFPFILMILCTEENKRSFSGALKRLNPFVTSKTLFFLPEKSPFLQRFFWPEWNWKIYFFKTWKISVFYTLFWPEWNWKVEKFSFLWHEKSPFFTPFFGLIEIEKIYFFMSYMKNLRFLHPFLAWMKLKN